jgi:hypothetical protein
MNDPLQLGVELKARSDQWDRVCGQLGFAPLVRLLESHTGSETNGWFHLGLSEAETAVVENKTPNRSGVALLEHNSTLGPKLSETGRCELAHSG